MMTEAGSQRNSANACRIPCIRLRKRVRQLFVFTPAETRLMR
jgi:hypothetical protein